MTTENNNKLIQEFMNHYENMGNKGLQYHSSWDWLIEVVEKIEILSYDITGTYEDVIINGCSCYIEIKDFQTSTIGDTKIQAVYQAVVQFIEWYNNQSK